MIRNRHTTAAHRQALGLKLTATGWKKTTKFYRTIGRKGGSSTSVKKAASSAANGQKGGRPRKVQPTIDVLDAEGGQS